MIFAPKGLTSLNALKLTDAETKPTWQQNPLWMLALGDNNNLTS